MAYPKVYVDGILLNWADRLFPAPYKRPRSAPGLSPVLLHLALRSGGKAARVRAQVDRTARKVPEVMVKVTNKKSAGRGMAAIREHLDYISRNAKIEMEDQDREIFNDRQALRQLKESWQVSGRRRIPDETENGRGLDALNLMFSMQPGTPPELVKDAVRDLLQEEFRGREYLFVLHTDKLHPHVHVCLKTEATRELPRLRHGRKELQRWREGFAENLRQRGIEANATPRPTRGQPRFPVPLHEYHRDRKTPRPPSPPPPVSPHAFQPQRDAWRAMAHVLNRSSRPEDVGLAKRIVAFWRSTPVGAVAPSPSSLPPEPRNHENPERLQRARIAAARLNHPALFEPDPGNPATRRQIEPLSRLRHVSGGDLVQDRQNPELLLQPHARGHLER
ncbi:relaxase/mobilization nuclease domain-containing protein [Propionivibrio sp.]|uniref:relaxase/mobilization nuclease domain-containing protein n=1 Tax=Propionivibrio sp. TaxID=2212460 RepID=UPI0039E5ACA9